MSDEYNSAFKTLKETIERGWKEYNVVFREAWRVFLEFQKGVEG